VSACTMREDTYGESCVHHNHQTMERALRLNRFAT
jgi:hypothetical protein